jgi:hypothetical protein
MRIRLVLLLCLFFLSNFKSAYQGKCKMLDIHFFRNYTFKTRIGKKRLVYNMKKVDLNRAFLHSTVALYPLYPTCDDKERMWTFIHYL